MIILFNASPLLDFLISYSRQSLFHSSILVALANSITLLLKLLLVILFLYLNDKMRFHNMLIVLHGYQLYSYSAFIGTHNRRHLIYL